MKYNPLKEFKAMSLIFFVLFPPPGVTCLKIVGYTPFVIFATNSNVGKPMTISLSLAS
jgi:hypothetical protein